MVENALRRGAFCFLVRGGVFLLGLLDIGNFEFSGVHHLCFLVLQSRRVRAIGVHPSYQPRLVPGSAVNGKRVLHV